MASDDEEEEYGNFYDDDDAEEDAAAGLEQAAAPPPVRRADYWAITQEPLPTAQHELSSSRMDGVYDRLDKGRERMLRDAGWTQHFYAAVESGKKQISCIEVKCPAFCDEDHMRRLLGQKYPEMAKRFNRFLLESYLEDNDSVKWCPSAPNCGRAICVRTGERYCEVECPCGLRFCFNCMAHAHSPCPCTIWEKWNAKRTEGENIKWILANTKNCPKCFKAIEKNGGCNLVRCNCGQCMCWLCGGGTGLDHTWTSIAGHSCNRYKEETRGKTTDTSREQMQRYKHYYDRFKIHGDSYGVEKQKLGPTVLEPVRLLETDLKRSLTIRDGDWLIRAHRRLLVSRQVLSQSYAFAYYMFGGELRTQPGGRASLAVARNLFEDQQDQPVCEVECPCGASFCFRCAAPAHSPCPCAMWERWEAKGSGEAENVKWLLANTKSCPKCFKPIIKEDGCNLVTCNCGQHLCWLCGSATGFAHTWTSIANHSCNRFKVEEKKKVDDAKRQVRRYEHCYNRFQSHGVSCRAEHEQLGPAVVACVARLESHGGCLLKDASWLGNAYRSLLGCRQALTRSYVFAYYIFDGEETQTRPPEPGSLSMAQRQDLFEDYQEQVEANAERLSKLLATDDAAEPL
ncbi:putative E3 ubiquitin-protein ligase ARI1 [Panicum miliaceum]|uniref:RBR-type E3 ubiquitin transferase n=1 Tax=Panicum miliaceum TaxID=4540 RepID=A0A3L6TP69_PANMI|nr:putative E3 ubiquitin-protein ligase ARI1 [Panicum miliaceum]